MHGLIIYNPENTNLESGIPESKIDNDFRGLNNRKSDMK